MRFSKIFRRHNTSVDEEIKTLRDTIDALRAENERSKFRESEIALAKTQQEVDRIFGELSQSVVYAVTQLSIIESGGDVAAGDLATTSRMTVENIKRLGGEFVGSPKTLVPYDPALHESPDQGLQLGTPVRIYIPGLRAPGGRVVRRATVETE